ncbi:MAG: hypothetical protein HY754_05525 [Nitrospirae bacterium]|nr:hypothetical protein [Nitrospirota bacterium]
MFVDKKVPESLQTSRDTDTIYFIWLVGETEIYAVYGDRIDASKTTSINTAFNFILICILHLMVRAYQGNYFK